jgi:hypothetical protein
MHALVTEAMKKAAIVWLTTTDGQPLFPVWCMPIGESLYVVSGGSEQSAPGLAEATSVIVTARGDHGGRIVSWPAQVTRITPGSDAWTEVATQLASKRLNASGSAEGLAARWTSESVVVALTPDGDDVEAGASAPTGSGAAVPRPTPAATPVTKPFRLHRVKRR